MTESLYYFHTLHVIYANVATNVNRRYLIEKYAKVVHFFLTSLLEATLFGELLRVPEKSRHKFGG